MCVFIVCMCVCVSGFMSYCMWSLLKWFQHWSLLEPLLYIGLAKVFIGIHRHTNSDLGTWDYRSSVVPKMWWICLVGHTVYIHVFFFFFTQSASANIRFFCRVRTKLFPYSLRLAAALFFPSTVLIFLSLSVQERKCSITKASEILLTERPWG